MAEKKKKTQEVDKIWDRLHAADTRVVAAQNALAAFIKKHSDVIDQLNRLQIEETAALAAAKSAYAENVSVAGTAWSGFRAVQTRELDAYELYDHLDDALTAELIETKLAVNREAFDAALASGRLDPVLARSVEKISVKIYSPKTVMSRFVASEK